MAIIAVEALQFKHDFGGLEKYLWGAKFSAIPTRHIPPYDRSSILSADGSEVYKTIDNKIITIIYIRLLKKFPLTPLGM